MNSLMGGDVENMVGSGPGSEVERTYLSPSTLTIPPPRNPTVGEVIISVAMSDSSFGYRG